MLDDRLDGALKNLIAQWNIAERRIKEAEQVRGNEVVTSSIAELRYAGRKVVDAIDLCLKGEWKADQSTYDRVLTFIADATEDCVKAKHDAIDAALDFVTVWFDRTEQAIGIDELQGLFPQYIATTAMISDIQDKIARSRENRNELRDAIYNEIEASGYKEILQLYATMRRSQERVAALVARRRRTKMIERGIAILAIVVAILAWLLPR